MASSVLGHIEKSGKGRVKIRWYSVNNLRTRVEQSPMHPQDQAGGSSLQQCRVQPDTQACWCASSEYQGSDRCQY